MEEIRWKQKLHKNVKGGYLQLVSLELWNINGGTCMIFTTIVHWNYVYQRFGTQMDIYLLHSWD